MQHGRITRTRSGCWVCRQRRKKCDQQLPRCSTCVRLNQDCERQRNIRFRYLTGPNDWPHSLKDVSENLYSDSDQVFHVPSSVDSILLTPSKASHTATTTEATSSAVDVSRDRFDRDETELFPPSQAPPLLALTRGRRSTDLAVPSEPSSLSDILLSLNSSNSMPLIPAASDTPRTSESNGIHLGEDGLSCSCPSPEGSIQSAPSRSTAHDDGSGLELSTFSAKTHAQSSSETDMSTPVAEGHALSSTSIHKEVTDLHRPRFQFKRSADIELLRVYLAEPGPWIEALDSERHFTIKELHRMLGCPPWRAAALALASRFKDVTDADYSAGISLELYQTAVKELISYEPTDDTSGALAAAVILFVYEMMAVEYVEWWRHLQGCAGIFLSHSWNGSTGGLVSSSFWAYVRSGKSSAWPPPRP